MIDEPLTSGPRTSSSSTSLQPPTPSSAPASAPVVVRQHSMEVVISGAGVSEEQIHHEEV